MKKGILTLVALFFAASSAVFAQKQKEPANFDEFYASWSALPVLSDPQLNSFCQSANKMVDNYKAINDRLNFVKIVIKDIPDSGDGVTTSVTITDGDGNKLEVLPAIERLAGIVTDGSSFVTEAKNAVEQGKQVVEKVKSDPMKAMKMAKDLKSVVAAIDALTFLSTKEVPRTIELVSNQINTLKSIKQM